MNINKLAHVKQAKYLGVILCNDLKDDGDIRDIYVIFMLGQIIRNYQKISPLFRGC